MDYAAVFAISAGGMGVERTRVEVAAMNLAHANTVHDASGAGYRPLRVIARAMPPTAFSRLLETEGAGFPTPEAMVEPSLAAPRAVHDPGHPLADGRGFVHYPGVDPATEMVSLMSATRAFEANVAAMNTARTLALKTLDIGRGG